MGSRRASSLLFVILLLAPAAAMATVFGNVRGIVHDPQHRPIAGATVVLQAATSAWSATATTNDAGEFEFPDVALGDYTITARAPGFAEQEVKIQVAAGAAPVIHVPLPLATVSTQVEVSSAAPAVNTESSATEVMLDRGQIARTPGATNPNSLALITDYVPGAYMVHDQLHVRGGHQVEWQIDGIPVPNTNIASNVGPQFDPKDIDTVEVNTGGYSADLGDRTYGVFNVVTRSGFERNHEGEIVANYGSYHSTYDQINFGNHSERFAWYGSLSGDRSDLGLEPPAPRVLHDMTSGLSGFGNLIYNASPKDQLRLVTSLRGDLYQIPNDATQEQAGVADRQKERDAFANFSWLHTFSPAVTLTVAPFYHFNRAAYEGSAADFPVEPTDDRGSQYFGGVVELAIVRGVNNARIGGQLYGQRDNTLFGLAATDGSNLMLRQRETALGDQEVFYAEDQVRAASWLTLSGGLRATRFSGELSETALDPRVGGVVRIPRLGWALRAYYGRYYQAPPLTSISGPLEQLAVSQGFGFVPLHGERDEQHEFGLAIPFRGWGLDISNYHTSAKNFFDHDVLGNSNIFLPLTIANARIRGTQVMLRAPKFWRVAELHLAFANQQAEGRGGVSGGLTDFSPPVDEFFYLDHDQRNTLSLGGTATLPWRSWMSAELSYGSGFLNGNGPEHLPDHASADFSAGKSIGENWSLEFDALNFTDSRYMIDDSNTFGGTHFALPRQISGQVKYRFHF